MRYALATILFLAAAVPAPAQSDDFRWSGRVAAGKLLEIKSVHGNVTAELASGNQVEVVATKHARRSDPASVSIKVVQEDGNVTICAVYPTPLNGGRPNECRPGSESGMNVRNNDVAVDFSVRVPAGVRFSGRTVNGSIEAKALRSDADVHTVNGRIALSTSGSGSAHAVNGSIDASLGSMSGTAPVEFRTVNGSITLKLPRNTNANLHAALVNGGFESDFPVTVQSLRGRNRKIDGTIGSGGRELDLHTVNGTIKLQFVPQ